jgi:hypothetical protein
MLKLAQVFSTFSKIKLLQFCDIMAIYGYKNEFKKFVSPSFQFFLDSGSGMEENQDPG